MSQYDKFISYREKYEQFNYIGFTYKIDNESLLVTYHFEIPNLATFNPTWKFLLPNECVKSIDKKVLEQLIFNLGMVEVISYWKTVCPKNICICGKINEEQKQWWKKLWYKGLGEFLYTNGIYSNLNIIGEEIYVNNVELITVKCNEKADYSNCSKCSFNGSGNLIPVGGGKDSVVTLELMKNMYEENHAYIINPREASRGTANIAGYIQKTYAPIRHIDEQLLKLNTTGVLNGHTPFSAIVAFSAYISAYILKKKYIVLSNEASANESNVEGSDINHQYSKSIEFENDFIYYSKKYLLNQGPQYFSLLRPYTEWQIVLMFAKFDQYFSTFKSCNVGSKKDIWCEKCPKCLYVYIMVMAHLKNEDVKKIFSFDLLNDHTLKNIYLGLIQPDIDKPFECVGTKEEINLALNVIYRKVYPNIPCLLEEFKPLEDKEYIGLLEKYDKYYGENNIPDEYEDILKIMR